MSKYSIKRIDIDPVKLGTRRKRIGYLFIVLSVIMVAIILVIKNLTEVAIGNTHLILMSAMYGASILYYVKTRNANRRIKDIGSIEFNQGGIVKTIGDIRTEYEYASIESLDLKKHLPAVSPKEGKKGYFTHILSITFMDSNTENLVVSDRPLGKFRDLSIVETLKTLRRYTQIRIEIN